MGFLIVLNKFRISVIYYYSDNGDYINHCYLTVLHILYYKWSIIKNNISIYSQKRNNRKEPLYPFYCNVSKRATKPFALRGLPISECVKSVFNVCVDYQGLQTW